MLVIGLDNVALHQVIDALLCNLRQRPVIPFSALSQLYSCLTLVNGLDKNQQGFIADARVLHRAGFVRASALRVLEITARADRQYFACQRNQPQGRMLCNSQFRTSR